MAAEEQLTAFITKSRQMGRMDDQITQQLLSVGWRKEKIEAAFASIRDQKQRETRQMEYGTPEFSPQPAEQGASQPEGAPQKQAGAAPQPGAQPLPAAQQPPAQNEPHEIDLAKKEPKGPITALLSKLNLGKKQAPQQQPQSPAAQQAPAPAAQQAAVQPSQQPAAQGGQQPALQQTPAPQQPPSQPAQAAQPPATAQPAPVQQPAKEEPKGPITALLSKLNLGKKQAPQQQPQSPAAQQAPAPAAQQAAVQPSQPPAAQGGQQPALQQTPAPQQPPPQEAAQQQPAAPPEKKGFDAKKFALLLAAALLLLALVGAVYFIFLAPSSEEKQEAPKPPPSPPPPEEPEVNIKINGQGSAAAPMMNCSADMGCLAEAAKACARASGRYTASANLFGAISTTTSYLEILGRDGAKCGLLIRTEDASVSFNQSLVASMVASGASPDSIQKAEEEATKNAKLAVGREGSCNFSGNDLADTLSRWKEGKYSSSDFEIAECGGKMFESKAALPPDSFTAKNSAAPARPPQNTGAPSQKNNSSAAPKQSASSTPKANASAVPPQPAGAPPTTNNTTNASTWQSKSFRKIERYSSTFPSKLAWFCTDKGGEYYRAFYQNYYGGDCTSLNSASYGYMELAEVASHCDMIPCCYATDPYKGSSTQILYIECGFA